VKRPSLSRGSTAANRHINPSEPTRDAGLETRAASLRATLGLTAGFGGKLQSKPPGPDWRKGRGSVAPAQARDTIAYPAPNERLVVLSRGARRSS
jgi:hypothetical protein